MITSSNSFKKKITKIYKHRLLKKAIIWTNKTRDKKGEAYILTILVKSALADIDQISGDDQVSNDDHSAQPPEGSLGGSTKHLYDADWIYKNLALLNDKANHI